MRTHSEGEGFLLSLQNSVMQRNEQTDFGSLIWVISPCFYQFARLITTADRSEALECGADFWSSTPKVTVYSSRYFGTKRLSWKSNPVCEKCVEFVTRHPLSKWNKVSFHGANIHVCSCKTGMLFNTLVFCHVENETTELLNCSCCLFLLNTRKVKKRQRRFGKVIIIIIFFYKMETDSCELDPSVQTVYIILDLPVCPWLGVAEHVCSCLTHALFMSVSLPQ